MAQLIEQGSTPLFDLFSIWPSGDDPALAASPSLSFDSSPWVTRVDCIAIIPRITFHNCFGEVTSGEIVFWKRRRWRMQNRRNMASHENIIIAFYIFSTLSPSNTQMWRWEQFQGRIGGSFEGSHSTMSHMRYASHSSLKTLLRIKSKLVIRELALRFKCKFRGKTFTESCLSLFSENFKEP